MNNSNSKDISFKFDSFDRIIDLIDKWLDRLYRKKGKENSKNEQIHAACLKDSIELVIRINELEKEANNVFYEAMFFNLQWSPQRRELFARKIYDFAIKMDILRIIEHLLGSLFECHKNNKTIDSSTKKLLNKIFEKGREFRDILGNGPTPFHDNNELKRIIDNIMNEKDAMLIDNLIHQTREYSNCFNRDLISEINSLGGQLQKNIELKYPYIFEDNQ